MIDADGMQQRARKRIPTPPRGALGSAGLIFPPSRRSRRERERPAGWVESSERQGHGHSWTNISHSLPPSHHLLPPLFPSRSSNPIIPNGRKHSVCPLTLQECFPPLSPAAAAAAAAAAAVPPSELIEWSRRNAAVTSCHRTSIHIRKGGSGGVHRKSHFYPRRSKFTAQSHNSPPAAAAAAPQSMNECQKR